MREQAPYLDRPSRSALRIYRNLAVYAWHIAAEEESAPIESDFLPCIRELVSQPEEDEQTVAALYVNGAISARSAAPSRATFCSTTSTAAFPTRRTRPRPTM